MKKNKKLQTMLFEQGLIENGSLDDIKNFKKKHRAEYSKEYNNEFIKRTKRKTLIFNLDEFHYLQKQADRYSMKLSPFIKAISFAYLNSTFIYPEGQKISEIEGLLREINRRVGESVQYIHLSRNITLEDIQSIKLDIAELEKFIERSLHEPPRLEVWLKQQIENDDMFLSRLLEAIAKYLTH